MESCQILIASDVCSDDRRDDVTLSIRDYRLLISQRPSLRRVSSLIKRRIRTTDGNSYEIYIYNNNNNNNNEFINRSTGWLFSVNIS
jgi:hypothetical protein